MTALISEATITNHHVCVVVAHLVVLRAFLAQRSGVAPSLGGILTTHSCKQSK